MTREADRLLWLMYILSEDGRAATILRPIWERRAAYPDRDIQPQPNTFEEARNRFALFHGYWITRQRPDQMRSNLDSIYWSGETKRILNRAFNREAVSVSEDAGYLAAVREARVAARGGLQFVYNQMIFSYIAQFEEYFADSVIMDVIPPYAELEDYQRYWDANVELLGNYAPTVGGGTQVDFMLNLRRFLKLQAQQLDPFFKRQNPLGNPPNDLRLELGQR